MVLKIVDDMDSEFLVWLGVWMNFGYVFCWLWYFNWVLVEFEEVFWLGGKDVVIFSVKGLIFME